jgi:hypothetical protein
MSLINQQIAQENQVAGKNKSFEYLMNSTSYKQMFFRVCLKSFKQDDFSKTCFECKYRVCEDCASYSKMVRI